MKNQPNLGSRRIVRNPRRTRRTSYRPMKYAATSAVGSTWLSAVATHPSRIVALILAGLMVSLMIWFAADLRFYVFAAQVQGASVTSADEVFRVAGLNGMSVFHIRPAKVAADVKAGVPGIEDVSISVGLPSSVTVRIREGDVRFIWRSQESSYLVDGEGRVVGQVGAAADSRVVINDTDGHPVLPGGTVQVDACRAASQLQELIPGVRSFDYSESEGISLLDARGWKVLFGDSRDLRTKVAVLQAIEKRLADEGQQAMLIDVRYPNGAYYR
ncbi:MAG: Cell division protein FtsQ [Chloroflexi bacterium ADurb.Bin180]|nr:MAG: Cell division protein FtsQ [Chloroflexi bacterium ADurb.Bin180]